MPRRVGKRLRGLVTALGLGAVALVLREALRSLDESRPDDPWGPHRKGL